jgi:arginine/ornithine N-succinyltransferase beta subunit
MARALDAGFADIIALARARLTQVRVDEDIAPERAILAIEGRFGAFRIVLKEVVNRNGVATRTTCCTSNVG